MGVRCCGYGAGPLVVGVTAGGMGRGRSLASGTLRRLADGGSTLGASVSGFHSCVMRLTMAALASSLGSEIQEEGPNFVRDGDGVKQEGAGGVDALGWGVSRVLRAWNILCVYRSIAVF
jgi:hypothetical protein